MTLADKLDHMRAWRQRVADSTDSYATPEWKARATATAERNIANVEAAIEQHGADFELPTITQALTSPLFDAEQRAVIHWQFRKFLQPGDFWSALLDAAECADGVNRERLALAFPDLMAGMHRYRHEDGYSDFLELIDKR